MRMFVCVCVLQVHTLIAPRISMNVPMDFAFQRYGCVITITIARTFPMNKIAAGWGE